MAVAETVAEILLPIVTTPHQLVKVFAACILPVVVVVLEHRGPTARSPTVVRKARCLGTAFADSGAVDAAAVPVDFV